MADAVTTNRPSGPTTSGARRAAPTRRVTGATEATMRGDLAQHPLLDLLQALTAMRRDGKLVIERDEPHQTASVTLIGGRVVDAYCPPLSGETCVYALAAWTAGRFLFLAGARAERETIAVDAQTLLMEAARRSDELEMIRSHLPAAQTVLHRERDADRLHHARLFAHEWRLLSLVDGRRTVQAILDAHPRDPVEAGRCLLSLLEAGAATIDERVDYLAHIVCRRTGEAAARHGDALGERVWSSCDGVATLATLHLELGCHGHDLVEAVRALLLTQRLEVIAGEGDVVRFIE